MLEGLNTGRPLLGIGKTKEGRVKKYKTIKIEGSEKCGKKDDCCSKEEEKKCEINEEEIETCGNPAASLQAKDLEKLSIAAEASDLF